MLRLRLLGPPEITTGSGSPASLPAQSKRTALLVYLTLRRPRRLLSRERILGLLWPESSQSQARHSLRQALYQLRKTAGEDLIAQQGHGLVGVDWDVLNCDVVQFEEAIAEGRLDDALLLYEGELLEGVQPSGVAAEFEQWLDGERERLRRMALLAACERASMEAESGNDSRAAHYVRRAARFAPTDETILRRLLQILDRVGDLTEAKLLYEDTCRRMEEDLGIPLSPETRSLMRQLESRGLRETGGGQTTVSFGSLLGLEGGTRWRPLPRRPIGDLVVALIVLLLFLALLMPQRRVARAASPPLPLDPVLAPRVDGARQEAGAPAALGTFMEGIEALRLGNVTVADGRWPPCR